MAFDPGQKVLIKVDSNIIKPLPSPREGISGLHLVFNKQSRTPSLVCIVSSTSFVPNSEVTRVIQFCVVLLNQPCINDPATNKVPHIFAYFCIQSSWLLKRASVFQRSCDKHTLDPRVSPFGPWSPQLSTDHQYFFFYLHHFHLVSPKLGFEGGAEDHKCFISS